MKYLNLEDTVDVMLQAAHRAGMASEAVHPEDIMIAMVAALEGTAEALEILGKKELI